MLTPILGLLCTTALISQFLRAIPHPPEIHFPWLIFFIPVLAVGTALFLLVLPTYLKSEIVLTDQRLKFRTGWLSLSSTEILLSKIETLTLREPLLGRLVGYGTVAVIGTGGTVFPIHFLPKPEYFHRLLQTIIDARQSVQTAHYPPVDSNPTLDDSRYMPKG